LAQGCQARPTTDREAHCACGALSARTAGDPFRVSICHCLECKRRTGTAFGWNATFDADLVQVSGDYRTFQRDSDDGFWVRHHFCETCGVSVFYEIERRPGMISIPAGAFADPDFPAPQVEVYEEHRCPLLPEPGLPRD
jgi:hypothetical protein